MPWYLILLSIMGTQASAITFLNAPGQAYTDGMRFVQYYFRLMIIAGMAIAVYMVAHLMPSNIGFTHALQVGGKASKMNIILFYGVILGIFLVAFWFKKIMGKATFYSAILSEIIVIIIYKKDIISFLWLNVVGAILAIVIAWFWQIISKRKQN